MPSAATTEGTSCGQWPPRPPGTAMATSAQPLSTEIPALSAGQTEILHAPPSLPQDPGYPPLAPLPGPAKGRGEPKRAAASADHEMTSLHPPGWIPPAIRAALADLGQSALVPEERCSKPGTSAPEDPASCAVDVSDPSKAAGDAPTLMAETLAQPRGAMPTRMETQAKQDENSLWDDLQMMLAEPPKQERATWKSGRQLAVPTLGSAAGGAQGVATRSRAAAESRPVTADLGGGRQLAVGSSRAEQVPSGLCDACRTPGSLLCCDECERAFHFTCLDPPWDLDRLPPGLVHDEPWSCNACRARTRPKSKGKSKDRLLRPLMDKMVRENPREFSLPRELQTHFHGVAADAGGAYLDVDMLLPWRPVTIKATKMMLAPQREPYRLRDKGELVLCFACGTSALPPSREEQVDMPRRPLLSCDFCPLHWHLDCLVPPCAAPPSSLCKWRCPAHMAHDLPLVHRTRSADQPHALERSLGMQAHRTSGRIEENGQHTVPEQAVQQAFWEQANKGVESLQAYAACRARAAKRGTINLVRAGQEYKLSVPCGVASSSPAPGPGPAEPPVGVLSAELRCIMTPLPYPSPLDSSLTFIAHPVPVPWPEHGGGVLTVPAVSAPAASGAGFGNAASADAAPASQRKLPSRRSKTTGEAQRRDHVRKRKRGNATAAAQTQKQEQQASVVHGAAAEAALWRSTSVVSHATATQLAALQRVVDYVGEEAVRRFVSA